jgi:2'-5' RNA ligase
VFSVELLPDARLDSALRAEWSRLIDAGLPSAGRHQAPSNRPHVTLAVRERLDVTALVDSLPLPIELGGVLLFGRARRYVLTRQVVPSAALMELHAGIAARLGPPEARYANTAPDRWSPHMTLARGLDAEQLALALHVIEHPPLAGEGRALRVWDAAARTVTTLE